MEFIETPVGVKLTWRPPVDWGGSDVNKYKLEWAEADSDVLQSKTISVKPELPEFSYKIYDLGEISGLLDRLAGC